tara:strand:- start:506 stop:1099 length:594 start_codon:yes stop_codon:yes gene_type:complete
MPANMKKAGMSYKKGGSKRKKGVPKKRVYKTGGGLKKASVGSWIDRNIVSPIGDLATGLYDTGAGIYDYAGDADRWYIGGDQDAFGWQETPDMTYNEAINQRRPGFLKTETGERHSVNPDQTTNPGYSGDRKTSNKKSNTTAADTNWRGVPQTQMTDAQYNQMMADKRAGKRYGGTKRYQSGGHIVSGKFLRQGPKR